MRVFGVGRSRIVVISQFPIGALKDIVGGRGAGQAATWLPQLASSFGRQVKFDIHWCILSAEIREDKVFEKWGQTFHLIPSPGISISMMLCRWPQRIAFKKLLGTLKPDLIHCWGTENLFGAALVDFHGPSILSMQGVVHAIHRTGDLKDWRWKLFRHWEKVSMAKASLVTAESQWGLDQVREIVPLKSMRKVEYGVSPSYYQVEWKPQHGDPRIFFAGGLNRLKGVDILVEMLKRYPNRPWKMVFAGDGYLRDELLALNDPSVEVLGVLKTSEVQEQMSKAWALVHPSRADTSPNVVKEARVIGLPVIGSPHGGHAEYIEHGKDGYLVETENPEEWFNVLGAICRDFEACTAMGAANHGWFRQYFRPEKTAEEFLELYAEMIGLRSASRSA